ncbi:hypothetical protein MFUM_240001 [Methylacidiphilum fumariolicum SolV]|uniref:Uncharacterized protein n=1 Tax=Methylacidiphilum fumariolicum (strain SolV) TaxID=1156937 RepID=I0JX86_METFB|nr:hypothetical protein MFUM_240001 [Methylacidiphilum fumariolicum SolV]
MGGLSYGELIIGRLGLNSLLGSVVLGVEGSIKKIIYTRHTIGCGFFGQSLGYGSSAS